MFLFLIFLFQGKKYHVRYFFISEIKKYGRLNMILFLRKKNMGKQKKGDIFIIVFFLSHPFFPFKLTEEFFFSHQFFHKFILHVDFFCRKEVIIGNFKPNIITIRLN